MVLTQTSKRLTSIKGFDNDKLNRSQMQCLVSVEATMDYNDPILHMIVIDDSRSLELNKLNQGGISEQY